MPAKRIRPVSGRIQHPRLLGKHALVTGAERGIGRAIAIALGGAGADVAVLFHDSRAAAEEVATEIRALGRQCVAVESALENAAAIPTFVSAAEDAIGPIDVLVNNAGILRRKPALETTVEDWEVTLAVNLFAPFVLTSVVAKRLIERGQPGSVINVTSVSQDRAAPGLVAYQTAKAGLSMLTRGLALELGHYQIRVNSIAPGTTVTDLSRDLLVNQESAAQRLAAIPLGRFGEPADHAGAAVFLASDESSWMTGASIVVDGGMTVR